MSTYLQQHSNLIKGKRVLELGAGCGLVGLVCALAFDAKSVLITDGDYQVLNNLRYNVQLNGLKLLQANDNDDDEIVTNEETSPASIQLTNYDGIMSTTYMRKESRHQIQSEILNARHHHSHRLCIHYTKCLPTI